MNNKTNIYALIILSVFSCNVFAMEIPTVIVEITIKNSTPSKVALLTESSQGSLFIKAGKSKTIELSLDPTNPKYIFEMLIADQLKEQPVLFRISIVNYHISPQGVMVQYGFDPGWYSGLVASLTNDQNQELVRTDAVLQEPMPQYIKWIVNVDLVDNAHQKFGNSTIDVVGQY